MIEATIIITPKTLELPIYALTIFSSIIFSLGVIFEYYRNKYNTPKDD